MTSIVSIVTAFMATFVLVFGYLTYSEGSFAPVEPDTPAVVTSESER
jgi:hypothetical protein